MPAQICPYLGLKDDADTALHYPAAGNHCHHARPIQPVASAHQRNYCLSPAYSACPVYQRAALAPLPAALSARAPLRLGRGWGIAAAVLLAVALVAGWLGRGGANGLLGFLGRGGAIPVTGGSGVERTPFRPGAAFTRTPPPDEGLLLAFSPSPNPTRAACPPPPGWGSYVVNPTDSLVRLSVLYNLELEELLAANCLEAAVGVRPGEVLYVPLLATPTNTAVQQPPTAAVVILPSPVLPTFTFLPPTQGPAQPDPPTQAVATGTSTLIPTVVVFTLTPSSTAPTLTLTLSPSETPQPSSTPLPTIPPEPTSTPAPTSTQSPVPSNTPSPTDEPTTAPSPTDEPTAAPTVVEPSPTDEPTDEPTIRPSPTDEPTAIPTDEPTALPAQSATDPPTQPPTDPPTATIVPASDTPQPTDLPPPEPSATSPQLSTPLPTDTPQPTDEPTAALTQAPLETPELTNTAPTSPPPADPTDEPNSDPTDSSSPGIILPTGIQ